jgi:hypothetical protein
MVALAYETRTYNGRKVVPLYRPDMAIELPVNLAPSTVFGRGTVIAEITSAANDVQTLTVTGTPTGGSLTIQVTDPLTGALGSYILPYNSSAGAAQTLIRAVLGANITVTGGALPGTPLVFTASGSFVGLPLAPQTILTNGLTGGTTPAGAFVHTTTGRTKGTYGPYNDGGSGGLNVAKAILGYDCATDAGGLITFGVQSGGGYNAEAFPDAPAWFKGYFDTKDLTGLDAAGIVDLGRLVSGVLADGVLEIY